MTLLLPTLAACACLAVAVVAFAAFLILVKSIVHYREDWKCDRMVWESDGDRFLDDYADVPDLHVERERRKGTVR